MQAFCIKFTSLQFDLTSVLAKKRRPFNVIPQEVKSALLSQELLQVWAPLSLVDRVVLIKKHWGVSVSCQTLWQFYLQNGIRYKTGKAVYRTEVARSREMKSCRLVFSRLIANLIIKGSPMIYMDETTFNTWQFKSRNED